jgi:hypothetical protein
LAAFSISARLLRTIPSVDLDVLLEHLARGDEELLELGADALRQVRDVLIAWIVRPGP